ncbi:unnamed protein product, partial [Notodromas monacha]
QIRSPLAEASDAPVKSAKQLEKDAKKLEKLEKLRQKQDKLKEQQQKKLEKAGDEETKPKKSKESKPREVIEYDASKTAPDGKKDVSGNLPNEYSPGYVEAQWYAWWKKKGFFKPEYSHPSKDLTSPNPKGRFVMVIPPPNVTGSLHIGHALTNAVEDTITRWHRMKGRTTLWVPGCDHAGIATQVVVEKKLAKERGISRHDLGRENFIAEIWKWREEKGIRIYDQLEKLGSSFDWDRACYTMDPKMCKAVCEAFVRMHRDGTIYRSTRLVNWSCTLKSAISDIEVDKRELTGRTLLAIPGYKDKVEFGVLTEFSYPVEGSESGEEIIVATTRLETMLGDTAVAVHPEDARYKHLHGKYVKHPIVPDRKMPIIVDDFVDMAFGTGAVKITPAHDHNDYEVGVRHKLPFVTVIDDSGNIVNEPWLGEFAGQPRFDVRKRLAVVLTEKDLFKGSRENPMVVPICSRSKDVVEPLIKPQWYVRSKEMAEKATEAVRSGELKIIPDIHVKTWNSWMSNIRDWCISRQLWWGHRIPAYFVTVDVPDVPKGHEADDAYWVSGRTEEEARQYAAARFGVKTDHIILKQDEDVLDTWFSSGLFPFSVMGWPDKTVDMDAFFPGDLLETGYDILFFWVARMVFLSQKLLGRLPFKEVFLHSIVRDAHGRKMSKSLGNVIDPIDVIHGITLEDLLKQLQEGNIDPVEVERATASMQADYPNGIPECGADALRFALCAYLMSARDINLDVLRVQGYRFFCNKLWNATKFAMMHLKGFEPNFAMNDAIVPVNAGPMDKWILSRLCYAVETCENGFVNYDFPSVTTAIYNFWLYEFCDVYLEVTKPIFGNQADSPERLACQETFYICLDTALRLLAPVMPFISEELWQRLPKVGDKSPPSICVASYPETTQFSWRDLNLEKQVEVMQTVVKAVRSERAEKNLLNKMKVDIHLCCETEAIPVMEGLKSALGTLAYADNVILVSSAPTAKLYPVPVSDKYQAFLDLKDKINIPDEMKKLDGKIAKKHTEIQKLEKLASDPDYETKVPEEVRIQNAEKLAKGNGELEKMVDSLSKLKIMNDP